MIALIVGASGGIGSALAQAMCSREEVTKVYCTRHSGVEAFIHPKACWHQVDVREEGDIERLAASIESVDWVVNCAGILHSHVLKPEKSILQLDSDAFSAVIAGNALPFLLLAKWLQPLLSRSRQPRLAVVSARLGSITENQIGGWYSYRASKAALNMAVKTLAIEWSRTIPHAAVAALHPGTTDTALSAPFQRSVPAHKLFTRAYSADRLLCVLEDLRPEITGRFWSWDGSEIDW